MAKARAATLLLPSRAATLLGAAAVMKRPRPILTFALLALAIPHRQALAYLDPTSGSMLLQILLGGFAGLAVGGRLLWHKITARLGRRSRLDEQPPA